MDMGFSEVLRCTTAQFGRKLGGPSARRRNRGPEGQERNRLTAQAENTKDPKKRRSILRYTSGPTRSTERSPNRSRVYNVVNRSQEILSNTPPGLRRGGFESPFLSEGLFQADESPSLELGSGHHRRATEFQNGSSRREASQSARRLQLAALSVLRLRLSGIPQGRPFRMRALRSQGACGQSGVSESPLPSAQSAFPLENVEGKGVGSGVGGARDGMRPKRHDAAQVRTETKEKAFNAE